MVRYREKSRAIGGSSRASSRRRCLLVVGALLLLSATLSSSSSGGQAPRQSQQPATRPAERPPDPGRASSVLVSPEADYRIGAGDVIEIQVEDMPEVSKSIRVTAAGTFLMPILGRMKALGKTPEGLAQEIADGLRGDYLKDPKVSVLIREYNSRSFFIQGAVRNPGVFQIEGRPSLLTLITLAGGLADNHSALSFIIRRVKQQPEVKGRNTIELESSIGSKPPEAQGPMTSGAEGATASVEEEESKYELLKVNINNLLRGNFGNNALLQPGDIVNIPPADVFYVAGEVKAPGSFSLKEGTTLRQAISLAQGTNYNAATERAMIFRDDASGTRQEIPVDIGAVMKGKKDDIPILANDIVIVPNSRMKSFGSALIKAFGLSTVTRVPVP